MSTGRRRRVAAVLRATLSVAGCGLATCTPRVPEPSRPVYSYAIVPPPRGSWTLRVEATFDGAPTDLLVAPEAAASMRDVVSVERDGHTAALVRSTGDGAGGDGWRTPACRARCTIRYAIDLDAVAARCGGMDCDRRIGDAILGRASTFMLRPEPMGDAIVRVHAGGPDVDRFATGLRPARDRHGDYVFSARDFGEASFTAFGALRRVPLPVPGGRLALTFLGPPLAMGDEAMAGFVGQSASCVAGLFGRFPVDATVFVVPVPGSSSVVFGRVMSLAGASVELLVGDATPASSVHDEWVVVHELFHLGTPSFLGEGRWLEEGLATYYEPIARARAGWMTEADLWAHFVREMPRGLRAPGDALDLEDRDDIDATYWGGALFALLADVNVRTATKGARSLDDVIRTVLDREGDGTHASRVADFLRDGDGATASHALTDTYQSWAVRGENPDLGALWQKLGIEAIEGDRDAGGAGGKLNKIKLHDDAPLAAVRKGITASFIPVPPDLH